jgi:uncharacterized protein YqjF (DUF2071 family)
VHLNRNLSPRLCRAFGCRKRNLLVLFTLLFSLAIPLAWGSSSVTLAWDPNIESNLAGYKVHYGAASGLYTNSVDAGSITTNRVTGLVDGVMYYFAVTAYNTDGQESDYSAEISYRTGLANQPPSISQIPDQQALLNASVVVPFTVGDNETPATGLLVGSSAADPSLVASITLSGVGSNRVATIAPGLGLAGSSAISLWVSDGVLSNAASFRVSFATSSNPPATNTPPFMSSIANQTTLEDVPTSAIPFLIGDNETPASNLLVTFTSSNSSLLPLSGIQLDGTGANRTLLLQPASNQFGTALVTISVSDGSLGTSTTFQLVVAAVNDRPEISAIANQTINEGTFSALIGFTVSDVDSPLTSLIVAASSSNPNLISSLSLGSSVDGSHRTLLLTPAANKSGASTITLTVSDGFLTNSTSFLLAIPLAWGSSSVTLAWDPNTEFNLAGYKVYYGVASGVYTNSVDVGNVTTNRVTGLAQGVTYYFAITAYNTSGQESDYSAEISYRTALANQPPFISSVIDQMTTEDVPSAAVPFVVGDTETSASNLVLTTDSSNPALLPLSGIQLGGTGANRTIQLRPAINQFGASTVTVTVSDGFLTSSTSFLLTVTPVNDPPTISALQNQTINEDIATTALPFTIGDNESPAANLVLSAASSNPVLVPPSAIVFGGSGSNRTVRILPATNLFGTATITLVVSDGNLSSFSSFVLTVNPVNDAPSLSTFKPLTIASSSSAGPIAFRVDDVETPATNLLVTAASSNPYLITTNGITFGGSGSNRTVNIKPVRRRTGTASITIEVSDGVLTSSNTFLVTVNSAGFAAAPTTDAEILAADLNGDSVLVSWVTTAGSTYRLLSTTNLAQPLWTLAAPDIQAIDVVTSWGGSTTNTTARFYRVQKMK